MRRELIPAAILAIAAQSLGSVGSAFAADPTVVPFSYTGAEQSWQVPTGVHSIHVVAVGGSGAINGVLSGGNGAVVTGDLAVSPLDTLYIEVGGNGSVGGTGGFNGGGTGGYDFVAGHAVAGGGGASDVRTVSSANAGSLSSRVLVAAGAGGAGSDAAGGSAGQPGSGGVAGGGAGTAVAGGAGGGPALHGGDGTAGIGGDGASACTTDVCTLANAGGGGGGGWFGGGGGGSGFPDNGNIGGGGGGGSSYTGAATNTSIGEDNAATPMVTISYVPGLPTTGTVDATVTMAESVICLSLSTAAIDFGTRQFGDVGVAGSPGITTTNCGGVSESVLAHGTDATGNGPTTWTLNDTGTCAGSTLPADNYALAVERQDTNAQVRLSTSNKAVASLAGGAALDQLARIDTPCPGGSGAGIVMTMHIVFVAAESAP